MISTNESNDHQKLIHIVPEESKDNRDVPCVDFPKNSTQAGMM